jgi:hypothetical protein
MPTLFIFGFGYTAAHIANTLRQRGWDVLLSLIHI